MSWLFSKAMMDAYGNLPSSQEQAGEYLAGSCSDGKQSAQLNVMLTAHAFWRAGKTMEFSSLSQFGQTLKVLTESHGADLLTSYLADFRAQISVPQERVLESKASKADSGVTWPALLARLDRNSSTWRTAQCSLVEGLDEFSQTWPRWGSMRNGVCWERQPPASLTNGTGSGSSLPTPSGVNAGRNHTMGRVDEWGGSSNPLRGTVIGSMCLPEFEELVMGWPVMWTAPMPFETAKFHEWQQEHSLNLPADLSDAA